MKQPGVYTEKEILSQPDAWQATLAQISTDEGRLRTFLSTIAFDSAIFTGCGSTYYLALAAAGVWQRATGLPAYVAPASEIWAAPDQVAMGRKPLLIAVSRSAETTETIRALEALQSARQTPTLTLTCYPDRPLSRGGDFNLVLPAGQENSVAQTRAFTVLYLTTLALAGMLGHQTKLLEELHQLPARLRVLMEMYLETVRAFGRDNTLDRFYFLGTGLRYGLASELSLKMKEMSLSHSEPFHTLEFRHGPKSMVTSSALVVGLLSQERLIPEMAVLDDVASLGGRTLMLGSAAADIAFGVPISDLAQSLLYLPFGQILAFERAIANGLDPDSPRNLDTVVRLDQ